MTRRQPWSWKRIDLPAGVFDDAAARFEAGFYEEALKSSPGDVDLLIALGSAYGRLGDIQNGLEVDRRLVEARPDEPVFHYNLACSYSLSGQLDFAFESLRNAIRLGYADVEHLSLDRDLDNLKRDRRFHEILAELQPHFKSEA